MFFFIYKRHALVDTCKYYDDLFLQALTLMLGNFTCTIFVICFN